MNNTLEHLREMYTDSDNKTLQELQSGAKAKAKECHDLSTDIMSRISELKQQIATLEAEQDKVSEEGRVWLNLIYCYEKLIKERVANGSNTVITAPASA